MTDIKAAQRSARSGRGRLDLCDVFFFFCVEWPTKTGRNGQRREKTQKESHTRRKLSGMKMLSGMKIISRRMKIISRRILNSLCKSTNTESGTGQFYKKTTRVTEWTLELRSETISDTALKTCFSDRVTRKLRKIASSTAWICLATLGSIFFLPSNMLLMQPSSIE